MTKKVIISEVQLKMLTDYINENDNHQKIVRRIAGDLDLNYEPTKGTFKQGGEFHEKPMVINKVNQEMMTPKSLLDYMEYKYKLEVGFLQQVINDWFKGNIKDSGQLSKNTPLA